MTAAGEWVMEPRPLRRFITEPRIELANGQVWEKTMDRGTVKAELLDSGVVVVMSTGAFDHSILELVLSPTAWLSITSLAVGS